MVGPIQADRPVHPEKPWPELGVEVSDGKDDQAGDREVYDDLGVFGVFTEDSVFLIELLGVIQTPLGGIDVEGMAGDKVCSK